MTAASPGPRARAVVDRLVEGYLRQLESGGLDPPRIVHVETRTRCNAACAFCLANVHDETRDDVRMPEVLVDRLIGELAAWKYRRRLSFYNNNEPFLDERLPDFLARARAAMPLCYLELKSNGRALTLDKIVRVFDAGLDTLVVNDYTTTGEHTPQVARLIRELRGLDRFRGHLARDGRDRRRILIRTRDQNATMNTRAGTSPNRSPLEAPIPKPCLRPIEMLTVSTNGTVSACSEDFLFELNLGNLHEQSLQQIWRSERAAALRHSVLRGDRTRHDACRKCDFAGWSHETLAERDLLDAFNEASRPLHSLALDRLRQWLRSRSAAPRR